MKKINLLSGTATKTFNLLSIGQRGVGKTVFLVGSYTELHLDSQTDRTQQLWFDCQDSQVQENMESILSYVVQTGQYPPPTPTMKFQRFNFSLKRHSLWGVQTVCHFRWWDLPGEICNIHNVEFRRMVSNSHGCCVFIDGYALVYSNAYLQAFEDIIEQVMAIASLVYLNGLKYPFAVILTKCDLIEPGLLSQQQLNQGLQPLTTRLDAVKANYQTFYSSIPIVNTESASNLRAKGAAAPLLWLIWKLSFAHNPGLTNNLLELVTRLPLTDFQPGQEGVHESPQSLFKPADKAPEVKKIPDLYLLLTARRNRLFLALAILGLMGVVISSLSLEYKRFLQREPKNLDFLSNPVTLGRRRHLDKAVTLMEKLVQQEPKRLDLRLRLAHLYETTGQVTRAETAYDQVLAQQNNNLQALVGLAVLRNAQGDTKTAAALFAQAEKAAPTGFKAQVRAVAQKTLQSPAK